MTSYEDRKINVKEVFDILDKLDQQIQDVSYTNELYKTVGSNTWVVKTSERLALTKVKKEIFKLL